MAFYKKVCFRFLKRTKTLTSRERFPRLGNRVDTELPLAKALPKLLFKKIMISQKITSVEIPELL